MKTQQLIVVNSGSSSIKFAAYEFNDKIKKSVNGLVENIKTSPVLNIYNSKGSLIKNEKFTQELSYEHFYEMLVTSFESNQFNYSVVGVGHRVVHGGEKYKTPIIIT